MESAILIGIVLAMFTIFSFFTKKPFGFLNIVVIIFMIALISPMALTLFQIDNHITSTWIIEVFRLTPYTVGPLLYIYTCLALGIIRQFHIRILLHFIPYIIAVVLMSCFATPGPAHMKHEFHDSVYLDSPHEFFYYSFPEINDTMITLQPPPDLPGMQGGMIPLKISAVLIYISLCIYTILILDIIIKHNRSLYCNLQNTAISAPLKSIVICFSISFISIPVISYLHTAGLIRFPDLRMSADIATSFFISAFSFLSLNHSRVYSNVSESDITYSTTLGSRRYVKSGLKDDEAGRLLELLTDYMISERPYINPDITINHVSEKLNIPKHHITQVINNILNKNFFVFINEYRLKEAKDRIISPEYRNCSILRIAYESGFNSKSTFNTIFKKDTGLTPKEYRKRYS